MSFNARDSAVEDDVVAWGVAQWEALEHRYDSAIGATGVPAWMAYVQRVRKLAEQPETNEWLAELASAGDALIDQLRSCPTVVHPTVFVSHQRQDWRWAEWVAWAATQAHFDYWLDVHDPTLTAVSGLAAAVKSVLVAGIIEMALINSTHIVSLQTTNAQKSRWVPYEFGRTKELRCLATNAATWFETGVAPDPNGDYLSLAFCATTSAELRKWLNDAGSGLPPNPNPWNGAPPTGLPN